MSQLRYHTVQYSKITVDSSTVFHKYLQKQFKDLKTVQSHKDSSKTAGAVILQLAMKLQEGNNFPIIPI